MKQMMLILAVALMAGQVVDAQENNMRGERKKVGVVLSGGGAKGMAHIGVL